MIMNMPLDERFEELEGDEPVAPPPADEPAPIPALTPEQRPLVVFEVLAVLAMTVLVSLLFDLWNLLSPASDEGFVWTLEDRWWRTLIGAIGVCIPVLYLMARSGLPWRQFGLGKIRWSGDVVLSVVLCLASVSCLPVVAGQISRFFPTAAAGQVERADQPGLVVLLVTSTLLAAFQEELIFRSYLGVRFEQLFSSRAVAVGVAAGMFAVLHNYQGLSGVVAAFCWGAIYSEIFFVTRRIWPLTLGHTAYNLVIAFMV
jgi:membrane protease YdiL (CAAX protease family)